MKCEFCKIDFEKLGNHAKHCDKNPNRISGKPVPKKCAFCEKHFSFLGNHTKYCRENPERQIWEKFKTVERQTVRLDEILSMK